jgi:hypothetical protein
LSPSLDRKPAGSPEQVGTLSKGLAERGEMEDEKPFKLLVSVVRLDARDELANELIR